MPSGRILSRTNKDQADVDLSLGPLFFFVISMILSLINIIIMIMAMLPLFFIVVIISFFFFWIILKKFLNASREIKRLSSINRSPILTLISEASGG